MSEFRMDGYINRYTGYGTYTDSSERYEYASEPWTPDVSLVNHYETNGLFAKIIDTPAEEAVKHGFNLALNNPDYEQYIEDTLDILDWEAKAATAIKWARLFGGAIIVMLIDDGGELTEPVNWDGIQSIDELRVYERPIAQPDFANCYDTFGHNGPRRKSKFGMPQYYQVSSVYGSFTVHESRCLVFRNGTLPEYTMLPEYRFWGMPEFARIRRAMREVSTSHSNATKLMERMVQAIYKQKNLASTLAAEGGEDAVMQRMRLIDQARSFLSMIAIDAEGEEFDFKTFQLSGVKDILDANCSILSAVTNIPQTILFGRSPAGENSTGDSDLENYYNYIERIQKMMLRDNLLTVLDAAFRAGASNGDIDQIPDYKLTFDPLWSLSEVDQANVDQAKAATALTRAQTAQLYVDMQVLDPSEVRKGLASTDEFDIEGLLDNQDTDPLDWGMEELPESGFQGDIPPKSLISSGENSIIKERNEDGGPGSGRYPKGSGKVDAATAKRYTERLTKVTTATGVKIKSISSHAMQRLSERNISEDTAADALENPGASYPGNRPGTSCCQKGNIRMVFSDSGNLVSAIVLNNGSEGGQK